MKTQITKISIFQNAKFLSIMILPFSLIYTIIGLSMFFWGIGGFIAIFFIFAPLWFSLMYFVMFSIFALIYNFVASKIGGIEFELTEIADNEDI